MRMVKMDQLVDTLDFQRMLIGDEPPFCVVEIIVRTSIVYAYTLVLLRWLGSRTIGQLSTVEFLLVIALGSAVGDAMFYPEVPLLHALTVVTLVVLANKVLDMLMSRSKRIERAVDGSPKEAIRDGVICAEFLAGSTLSNSELFQQLRQNGIENLGQVEHAYVETDGVVTVFKASDSTRPGLPIVPPWEVEPPVEVDAASPGLSLVCLNCGVLAQEYNVHGGCSHQKWTIAKNASRDVP
jgi:uncharacterized membrane protein YcaP (DUF421 family)